VLLLGPTGDRSAAPAPDIDGATVAYLGEFAQTYDGSTFSGTPPAAGDLAALFHIGGTTGKPKPAAHTHGNEVADA
jgi:fatty-acyl-CoA synthase